MNKLNQLSEITSSTKIGLKNSIGMFNESIEQNANESLLNSTSIDDYFDAHQSISEHSPVDCTQTVDKFIDKNTTSTDHNQQTQNIVEKSSCDNNSDNKKQEVVEHLNTPKSLSLPKKSPIKGNSKIENNTGIFYTFANAIKNAMRISTNTTINNSNVNNNYKKSNSITINEDEPAASSTICHKPLVPSSNFIIKDLINSSTLKKCESSSSPSSVVPVLSPYLSPKLTAAPGSPLLAGKSMDLIFSKTEKRRRETNLIINHLSPVRSIIDDYKDKEISSPLYKQKKIWNIRARDPIARMKNNFTIKSKSLDDENYIKKNNKIDDTDLKRTWNIRAREPIARMKNLTIKSKSLDHFQQIKNGKIIDKTDKSLTSMIETMSLKNKPFQQQKNNSQIVDKIKASNFKRIIDPMTSFD